MPTVQEDWPLTRLASSATCVCCGAAGARPARSILESRRSEAAIQRGAAPTIPLCGACAEQQRLRARVLKRDAPWLLLPPTALCLVIPFVSMTEGFVVGALAALLVPGMARVLGRRRVVMPVTVVYEDETSLTLAIRRPGDERSEGRMPLKLGIPVFGLLLGLMAIPVDILWRSFNPVVFFDNPTYETCTFLIDGDGPFVLPPGPMAQRRLHHGVHRLTLLSATGPSESWSRRVRWNTRYIATMGPPSCYVNVIDGIDDELPSAPQRWTRIPDPDGVRQIGRAHV